MITRNKNIILILSCLAVINCLILWYGLYNRNNTASVHDNKCKIVKQENTSNEAGVNGDKKEEPKGQKSKVSTGREAHSNTGSEKKATKNETVAKPKTTTVSRIVNTGSLKSDCPKWDAVIDKYAKSKEEATWAKRVMRCESWCRTGVVNSLGYTGLFQWSPYYWMKQFPKDSIFDGYAQVKNSLWKYEMGGKGIWVCK